MSHLECLTYEGDIDFQHQSRSHIRVDGFIGLKYVRITEEEYIRKRQQYLTETIPELTTELYDSPLFLRFDGDGDASSIPVGILNEIDLIHKKLDFLRKLMSNSEESDLFEQKPVKVNLSGAGVGFSSSDSFQLGDLLDMRMLLPTCPFFIIEAVGEVVRIDTLAEHRPPLEGPSNYVAVKFVAINEDSREAIIRCVFTWQRKILRERKMRIEDKRSQLQA